MAASRTAAGQAIRSGTVAVAGRPDVKAATLVAPDEAITLSGPPRRFVSRGGEKLETALERFEVDVTGMRALDAGASTGGFTDCLLKRGAGHVVAVDVGYGQLDWRLRQDDRVTVLERTNVRTLDPSLLPYRPQIVTGDLSFISLRLAIPALVACSAQGTRFVLLVKPQFEAGRGDVGTSGVVADPDVWLRGLEGVATACRDEGLGVTGAIASPLVGPAGNVEFFLGAVAGAAGLEGVGLREALAAAIREGSEVRTAHG
jgi:23S rRNA (cytidine1920-2'-O)/16S rRNA (cytidine1409-2'-O)-methyltransferase